MTWHTSVLIASQPFKPESGLEPGQRFSFHNVRHSLASFLARRGKDVKSVQDLLRHEKVSTTLHVYSQTIDGAKLAAQEEIAAAIKSTATAD